MGAPACRVCHAYVYRGSGRPTITPKSLPHTAVKLDSYCCLAPPKRQKTTKSRRGARRLQFAKMDSILLKETIQRNRLLHQAQRLFTDSQLSFINAHEGT